MKRAIPGLEYRPNFLNATDEQQLVDVMRESRLQRTWPWKPYRRSRWHRVSFGWEYTAASRPLRKARLELPPLLATWRDRCGDIARVQTLDQVSVNWYPPGAGIGAHIDAPLYGEMILVLSLASIAKIQWKEKATGKSITTTIEPRSLYIMTDDARWRWSHQVLPVPVERYAIVFRTRSEK
ncbi:MAG: alpha-ketoglutarate-dependent dioxygenase AlkB [Candidatus Binatia bacterium]